MKTIIAVIAFVLLLDVFAFGLWAISGQNPNEPMPNDIYLGAITNLFVKKF